jgi:sugar phosphate isomerase/epimerase
MIYISTHFSNYSNIINPISKLAQSGFNNIELTGGTNYYNKLEADLINIKSELNLNFQLHNYFPPPKEHFVFNLASLDKNINQSSIEHAKNAIALSRKLNSYRMAFHAGFFIHIGHKEIGKQITNREFYNENEAIDKFVESLKQLTNFAGNDFKIYIENNVVSENNIASFNGKNPAMLTDYQSYLDLKEKIDFNILLDIAHLKVSAKSLGLNFNEQVKKLIDFTDYIHISDNNGLEDQNRSFEENSSLFNLLKNIKFNNKIVTLEIFGSINKIKESYDNLLKVQS